VIEIPVVLAAIYVVIICLILAALMGLLARVRYLDKFITEFAAPTNKLTGKPVKAGEPAVFDPRAKGEGFSAAFSHLDVGGNIATTRFRITKRYVRPAPFPLPGKALMEERDRKDEPWTPCAIVDDSKGS
jgi:hypothetical protein